MQDFDMIFNGRLLKDKHQQMLESYTAVLDELSKMSGMLQTLQGIWKGEAAQIYFEQTEKRLMEAREEMEKLKTLLSAFSMLERGLERCERKVWEMKWN